MQWLNYHHLFYFWVVAKTGSITKSCKKLRLAQPTISAQIQQLEKMLGEQLFERKGRRLILTQPGQIAFEYAEEIFTLGREMTDTLQGLATTSGFKLRIGLADVLPKFISLQLIKPAFKIKEPIQIICFDGKPQELFARLGVHDLDVVLSDQPMPPEFRIKAYNHYLGDSSHCIFGTSKLVEKYGQKIPSSLNNAPFLLPTQNTAVRKSIDEWFESVGVRPKIAGEFEDSAVLKVFGQEGMGLFFAASAIQSKISKEFNVVAAKRIPELRERFYAISIERKIKHPGIIAITKAAKNQIFHK